MLKTTIGPPLAALGLGGGIAVAFIRSGANGPLVLYRASRRAQYPASRWASTDRQAVKQAVKH